MRMRRGMLFLIIFTLAVICSCQENKATPLLSVLGGNGTTDQDSVQDPAVAASDASEAGDVSTLVKLVPDAENAFFTDTGRLFVSGNTGLFEITNRGTRTTVIQDNYGMFGGIAQSGKWLYVIHLSLKRPCPQ